MCHLKHRFRFFFILSKNYASFSRYSRFCIFNHPMIYQICDVIMSISTWDKVHFWIYLFTYNSRGDQTTLFYRKIMLRSQDIQDFVFLTIPWFTKSVTSWWVLVHEARCIFEYIFWTTTHEVTRLGQLIVISKENNFQQSFEQVGGLGKDSRSFLI